jgi:hypothetical protein
MKNVVSRSNGELGLWTEGFCGYGKLVLFGRYNVMSYAMARLKADPHNHYRSNDPRVSASLIKDEAGIRAMLEPGGRQYKRVTEEGGFDCGAWRRHVLHNIAIRDGDADAIAEYERVNSKIAKALGVMESALRRP